VTGQRTIDALKLYPISVAEMILLFLSFLAAILKPVSSQL
jgi:hypothetical protein